MASPWLRPSSELIWKLIGNDLEVGAGNLSREGNTVLPKVIWFGFRSIGNSVWTKLPE